MPNNKNQLQQTWLVTSWEFMHFFKLKQEIISKLILLGVALLVMLWQYIKEDDLAKYKVAISPAMNLTQQIGEFEFITTDKPIEQLKQELAEAETWHALLEEQAHVSGAKQITLHAKDKQSWQQDLQQILTQEYSRAYADSLGLAQTQLAVLSQPALFENKYLDSTVKSDDSPAQATAIGMIILLAVGIFTSFGQLFVSVTGEKQQRVTEQLYSCISPQTWIDGKILGQMLHAIKAMITTTITALLSYAFFTVVIGGETLDLSFIDWSMLPWLLPFAITGVYFCTAFMAAIAAAIDDPNHSGKTSFMLLPMVPMLVTFMTMDSPSGWALTFLSYFPLTSFAAMPVKMSLIDVPVWEPILALALLFILCFWIRTAAANLFKMGMTMYGKEPTVKDMMLWMVKRA